MNRDPRLVSLSARRLFSSSGRPLDLHADLEPVTMVRGANEAGKSTLLGLIELLTIGPAAGRWPVAGKSPDYDFMATGIWKVGARGMTVERGIHRGKHLFQIGGRDGLGIRATQSHLDATLGSAAQFDLADFVGMTPPKRLAWLEAEILGSSVWEYEQLDAEIGKELRYKLDTVAGCDLWRSEAPSTRRNGPQGWLTNMIAAVASVAKDANRDALRLAKVVANEGIALRNQKDLPAGSVASWTREEERLLREKGELREQRGTIIANQAAPVVDLGPLRQKVADKRAVAVAAFTRVEDTREALKTTRGQWEALKADLPALEARETATGVEWHSTRGEHQAAVESHGRAHRYKARGEDVAVVVAHFKDGVQPQSVQEAVARVMGWLEEDRAALNKDVVDNASRANTTAHERHTRAVHALRQHRNRLADCDRAWKGFGSDLQTRLAAEATASNLLTEAAVNLSDAEAAMTLAPASGGEGLDLVDMQIEAIDEELVVVRANKNRLNDATQARAGRELHSAELDMAKESRTLAREVAEGLRKALSTMLVAAVEPLMGHVSQFTEIALGQKAWADLSTGFVFGVDVDREGQVARVPWPGSDSQSLALSLGFLVALQSRMMGWRCLVVDRMEAMAPVRRDATLRAALHAVELGLIDNFIGACWSDPTDLWTPPKGVHTVELPGGAT